jgi:Nif-specific regulatory protein
VNCAALAESVVESELFGHEKGAFTGAHTQRKGRFELAEGGTLFLDEVGELTPSVQAKLLRVLQSREFERLGGAETLRSNVRIVAATNKDLERATAQATFREDLYYRLNVFSIQVPPLRERRSDIPSLARHFVAKFATAHDRRISGLTTAALDRLTRFSWPGNVRQLENVLERAVLVCSSALLDEEHLPPVLREDASPDQLPLAEAVARFEKQLLENALEATNGNRARAARLLQTTERILGYKVTKLGIDCDRFRGR